MDLADNIAPITTPPVPRPATSPTPISRTSRTHASCGANFNGLGPDAGITIVGGHEMGETITDQFPNGGWLDSNGAENGDKCAWISSGQGASVDISISTGMFPVQSLWNNAFNSGSGGCVLSYP